MSFVFQLFYFEQQNSTVPWNTIKRYEFGKHIGIIGQNWLIEQKGSEEN